MRSHTGSITPPLMASTCLHRCCRAASAIVCAFTELLHVTREHAGALATVTHSGSEFVEVAAAGVTKALALAHHCAERGIRPGEVIAFGDMPNDIPMLSWAGRAVAVANADPEALAVAHEITRSNDEDGVAHHLEQLAAQDYVSA